MADEHENAAVGVTLWLQSASLTGLSTGDSAGNLQLYGQVRDESVWREIVDKFKTGLRIYASNDFHLEVLGAMRNDLKRARAAATEAERKLEIEKEKREEAEKELERYKKLLRPFTARR